MRGEEGRKEEERRGKKNEDSRMRKEEKRKRWGKKEIEDREVDRRMKKSK